jgi:hypothetical protein
MECVFYTECCEIREPSHDYERRDVLRSRNRRALEESTHTAVLHHLAVFLSKKTGDNFSFFLSASALDTSVKLCRDSAVYRSSEDVQYETHFLD